MASYYLAASGQNRGKNLSAIPCNKNLLRIHQRPLLISCQLSCSPEWLLIRRSIVICQKIVDFVIMLHLSVKPAMFTKITISATEEAVSPSG